MIPQLALSWPHRRLVLMLHLLLLLLLLLV